MKVELIAFKLQEGFISRLHFRVCGETAAESPLFKLQNLITLLESKGLNSYVIEFIENQYHKMDIEIDCEYPRLWKRGSLTALESNLAQKIKRFEQLFSTQRNTKPRLIAYSSFIACLTRYAAPYASWDDNFLFNLPIMQTKRESSYQAVSDAINSSYHADAKAYFNKRPTSLLKSLSQGVCAFDRKQVISEQTIISFGYFRVAFNHLPWANSSFHLMIIPNAHAADMRTINAQALNELQIIFKAISKIAPTQTKFYMQKHGSSGMSVPHMHIHAITQIPLAHIRGHFLRYLHSVLPTKNFLADPQLIQNYQPLNFTTMMDKGEQLVVKLFRAIQEQANLSIQQKVYAIPRKQLSLMFNLHSKEQDDKAQCSIEDTELQQTLSGVDAVCNNAGI